MKFNLRQKFLATVIVTPLLVGVFGWLYIAMASAVRRADSGLAQVEASIAGLERERRQARIFERTIEGREKDLARIENFFVDHERPLEFIEQLESLAKVTGSLIALNIESPTAGGRDLNFRITLDGFEPNVARYLKLFELLPYEIKVQELTLQKIEGSRESDTRLTMLVVVKTR